MAPESTAGRGKSQIPQHRINSKDIFWVLPDFAVVFNPSYPNFEFATFFHEIYDEIFWLNFEKLKQEFFLPIFQFAKLFPRNL